ncbi:MAG: hypothetical protein HUJ56_02230 [Erysipelotrichaceae bacterium]|nr:hypothetical protein [Erysipelotrichaceae bacterium]
MKKNITITTYIYIAIAFIVSIVMGLRGNKFFLEFTNWMTIFSIVGLALAFNRSNYISGDSNLRSFKTAPEESYSEFRERLKDERLGLKNPLLPASLFLTIITIILTLLYHYNIL